MTKSEVRKLEDKEVELWNDLTFWEGLLTEEELETCKIYSIKLASWHTAKTILQMFNIEQDWKSHKTKELK